MRVWSALATILCFAFFFACSGQSKETNQDSETSVDTGTEVGPPGFVPGAYVWQVDSASVEQGLFGSYSDLASGRTLNFDIQVERETGVVNGSWSDSEGNELKATLETRRSAVFSINGVTVDEDAPIDSPEAQALLALYDDPTGAMLLAYVFELACQDLAESDAQRATALLPWQLMHRLKVRQGGVTMSPAEVAKSASCEFAAPSVVDAPPDDVIGRPIWKRPRGLVYSEGSALPHVFGQFPFSVTEAGETNNPGDFVIDGGLGICQLGCAGSAGQGCFSDSCKIMERSYCEPTASGANTGYLVSSRVVACLSHEQAGFLDACYENCNEQYLCGTWDALACQANCDFSCVDTFCDGDLNSVSEHVAVNLKMLGKSENVWEI